ncbi:MAG: hypothetical protein AABX83_00570 [Nanoarchaeota archaeon]
MAVNIHNLIAAINPDVFCDPEKKSEVKAVAKERGYLAAAEKAEVRNSEYMDLESERLLSNPFKLNGIKNPIEKHSLVYDNFSQGLEPIYFWIVDYINKEYEDSEKLIDNFTTSVGSAQFGEMGQRTTRMQEEAMKMLGTSGAIVKSILNIIYDLKEFKIRLSTYDDLKSNDRGLRNAGLLSLKQIWLDQVDFAKRGTTSLKQLAVQYDYVTIIDAFMVANSLDDIKKIDLNERVRRILEQRVSEFEKWIKESEQELRKRYEIEKVYLKNQVSSVKLYARWIKPYLKSAKQLEQRATTTASLVNAFNTTLLELVVLGVGKYKIENDVNIGLLPKSFKKIKTRKYIPLVIVEFQYRSAPERTQQGGYGFRGRVEIDFTSYALNDEELKIFKQELEKDDLGDLMQLLEGSTSESLGAIQLDLDEFLDDKKKEEKKESNDINPFSALFSIFKTEKKKDDGKGISKDTDVERVMRNQALIRARVDCSKLYGSFKGANEMPGFS